MALLTAETSSGKGWTRRLLQPLRRRRVASSAAAVLIVLSLPFATVLSDDAQRQDQLVWDYAEFVQAFSAKDWVTAARFVGRDAKIGFGGESGTEGMVRVFGDDDQCHGAMTRALESGCRKIGEGDAMRCISPPYDGPDVVYLGARASFRYSVDVDLWTAEYLVCGGD